jgi:hypothetical protein
LGIVNADGLATTAELLTLMSRKRLAALVRTGARVRVWHGVYALGQPDALTKLAALDMAASRPIVACMGTAAALYGFEPRTPRGFTYSIRA